MTSKEFNACPVCGRGTLELRIRNKEFKYKGHRFIIEDYVSMECDRCKEGVLDSQMIQRNEAKIKEHHRHIDEGA